jgi:hypothetical protein
MEQQGTAGKGRSVDRAARVGGPSEAQDAVFGDRSRSGAEAAHDLLRAAGDHDLHAAEAARQQQVPEVVLDREHVAPDDSPV